ncbi:MAG: putative hydro-lyase [Bacteroidales bacterium]|nr:putative hydro-lyase [Bacteroidales bacterium]
MTGLVDGVAVRAACRAETLIGPTPGLAPGCVQANLVLLPRDWAFDFMLFCHRNPQPCPLLDVTDPGDPEPKRVAPGADLRTDLPKYRIWEHGELVAEPTNLLAHWRDDLVGFLIGCSFTFENALLEAGVTVRHIEQGVNVPMYRTNVPCISAGRFRGQMVVSMRPLNPEQTETVTRICAKLPLAHGAPVHVGDPARIGIADIAKPDYGDPVTIHAGEQPVFWACGVTPQAALLATRPPFAITHAPGHMFVTDQRDSDLLMTSPV